MNTRLSVRLAVLVATSVSEWRRDHSLTLVATIKPTLASGYHLHRA